MAAGCNGSEGNGGDERDGAGHLVGDGARADDAKAQGHSEHLRFFFMIAQSGGKRKRRGKETGGIGAVGAEHRKEACGVLKMRDLGYGNPGIFRRKIPA